MKRKPQVIRTIYLIIAFCLFYNISFSQDSLRRHRIAVFAPLYLDSAFTADNSYRYSKYEFPKFINPGLEFYEGLQLALDSMNKEKAPLEVFIYDTRSASESVIDQLNRMEMDSVKLIITYCSSPEVKTFADAGRKRNIPVINTNLPFDGYVTSNPYFVMLNSTLKTQCEEIYRHLQKYYSNKPIVVFRKNGQLEEMIRSYFTDFSKITVSLPLKLNYVNLPDSFSINQLIPHLDSTRETICVAGTLDENFGKRLAQQIAYLNKQNYPATVIGMPTWDNIRDFNKPEYKGIEIVYSTPFYNPRNDIISTQIIDYFNRVMFARPSDMVLRGYEVMWKFGNLLLKYKSDFPSSLTHKEFNIFREFDIQPVIDKKNMTLNYFENRKLYFLKWQDGILKGVY